MPLDLTSYIDDRPADGVFRVHRDVFASRDLFEMEQRHIFAKSWNFLALELQIAKPNDFITTYIGLVPVLVMRDGQGKIGAFLNACRHKGAMVCGAEQGNTKHHVCPYHGWAYGSDGGNIAIKDRASGAYLPGFDRDNHDLLPLARLESYKGLIFGSLSPEVPDLGTFLGDMRILSRSGDGSRAAGHGIRARPHRLYL